MPSIHDRENPTLAADPRSRRPAARGVIFVAVIVACLTIFFIRTRSENSSVRPPLGVTQSAVPVWKVSACSLVPDDRIAEGQSVQLTLLGSTTIHATAWDTQCRIPIGTEFRRDGDFMCNPAIAGPADVGCFGIRSETGR
ncbi:MAG TPA: hypothetical protein VF753_18230 [Terriglobales bacterium]